MRKLHVIFFLKRNLGSGTISYGYLSLASACLKQGLQIVKKPGRIIEIETPM